MSFPPAPPPRRAKQLHTIERWAWTTSKPGPVTIAPNPTSIYPTRKRNIRAEELLSISDPSPSSSSSSSRVSAEIDHSLCYSHCSRRRGKPKRMASPISHAPPVRSVLRPKRSPPRTILALRGTPRSNPPPLRVARPLDRRGRVASRRGATASPRNRRRSCAPASGDGSVLRSDGV